MVGATRITARLSLTRLAAALLLAALLTGGPARAQNKVEQPPLGAQDLARMMERLELGEDERRAATAIFDGSMAVFLAKAAEVQKLREAAQRARDEKSPDAARLVREHNLAWSELVVLRADVENALLGDIKALLTPAQLETAWPAVERERRRETIAFVVGSTASQWYRVDLCKVVAGAGLSDEELAVVRPILDEYEFEIDRPLAERKKMWDEEMHWPQDRRERENEALTRRNYHLGARVGVINRKYAKWILTQVPPPAADRIREVVWRTAYMNLYDGPRPARGVIDAARGLADEAALTTEQDERLAPIIASYERESTALDRRGREVYDAGDDEVERWVLLPPEERDRVAKSGIAPFNGVYEQVAIDRRELEARVEREVRAVLTAGQREQLDLGRR